MATELQGVRVGGPGYKECGWLPHETLCIVRRLADGAGNTQCGDALGGTRKPRLKAFSSSPPFPKLGGMVQPGEWRRLCRVERATGTYEWRIVVLQEPKKVGSCKTQFVIRKYRVVRLRPLEVSLVGDLGCEAHTSKGGRLDLMVHIPAGPWEGRQYLHRIAGWEFYRPYGVRFSEFQNRLANGTDGPPYWQVDHVNGRPGDILLGQLRVVSWRRNSSLYWARHASGVRKRPASSAPRRPGRG